MGVDATAQERARIVAAAQYRWLTFSVALGFFPIGAILIAALLFRIAPDRAFRAALGEGQLLIAAVALSGASVGRILTMHQVSDRGVLLAGVSLFQSLLGAVILLRSLFLLSNFNPLQRVLTS